MVGVNLAIYERVYERIKKRKELEEKRIALQDKIEQAEANLQKKRTEHDRSLRDASQKKSRVVDKFGDPNGKVPDSMSQEAWMKRYNASVLVEKKGDWEHRRIESEVVEGEEASVVGDDDKMDNENQSQVSEPMLKNFKNIFTPVGMDFYYKGHSGGAPECSWDPPVAFDNFARTDLKPGDLVGDGTVDLAQDSEEMKMAEKEEKIANLARYPASERSERARGPSNTPQGTTTRRFRTARVDKAQFWLW